MKGIHCEIRAIALPAIVANIAEPLLGLLDTGIAGHLGAPSFIGAVAVGAMMINVIYWNFEFLRMGTSGATAQAYGATDGARQRAALRRSMLLALAAGVAIVALQGPLRRLALWVISPGPEVARLAAQYFTAVIWGAPAVLLTIGIKGWLLGMQDSRGPMAISITVNVLNVVFSLVAVYALGMGFMGIAWGTLAAVWLGLGLAVWLAARRLRNVPRASAMEIANAEKTDTLARFFKVNFHIFVRCVLMIAVTLSFTSIGARSGDNVLAANSMMIQLFLLFSYFMDGVAFAGEAVAGKYYGAGDGTMVRRCVRALFVWALAITLLFTLLYVAAPRDIFTLFTSHAAVVATAMRYRWWCAVFPLAGMAAFVWDGVFVGLSLSRGMLLAVALAAALFFALYFALPAAMENHRLWTAFIAFLAARSAVQTVIYAKRKFPSS